MPRTLSPWFRDVLLLVARSLVAVVMLAHVWQSFVTGGFWGTAQAFANFGIPIAIVATAFTLVVELVGSFLLLFGVLVPVAATGFTIVMGGAIFFVHAQHGIFVKTGGVELVGMIIAVVLAIAAAGPGRLSVQHVIDRRRTAESTAATAPRSSVTPTPAFVAAAAAARPVERSDSFEAVSRTGPNRVVAVGAGARRSGAPVWTEPETDGLFTTR